MKPSHGCDAPEHGDGALQHLHDLLHHLEARVIWLQLAVGSLLEGEAKMAKTIDDILNDVAELPSIDDSLDALFAQLQALIAAGQTDPAKLQQASDMITTFKDRTKAAITANTPAAPPTP